MLRVRFHANEEDYRPVKWPVKHPFWCTGYGDGYSIVVAYADNVEEIMENWPEATELDIEECSGYTFTSSFPKSAWLVL